MKFISFLFVLITVLTLPGCKSNTVPKGEVSAKVIEYKVNYLSEKAGEMPTKLLPGKMTVIFAGHYALNRIEGFFGQFSLVYIGNLKTESVITLLKLFDKKYVCYGKKGDLPCGFKDIQNLKIEETGNHHVLLGYKCKEIKISSDDSPTFFALCTDKINVRNPNITTPYKKINEVLMEFNTHISLLDMKLTAISVHEQTISWDSFRVPEDYKERSYEFMENTISELFK